MATKRLNSGDCDPKTIQNLNAHLLRWVEFLQRAVAVIEYCTNNLVDGIQKETNILSSSVVCVELVVVYVTIHGMSYDSVPVPIWDSTENLHAIPKVKKIKWIIKLHKLPCRFIIQRQRRSLLHYAVRMDLSHTTGGSPSQSQFHKRTTSYEKHHLLLSFPTAILHHPVMEGGVFYKLNAQNHSCLSVSYFLLWQIIGSETRNIQMFLTRKYKCNGWW